MWEGSEYCNLAMQVHRINYSVDYYCGMNKGDKKGKNVDGKLVWTCLFVFVWLFVYTCVYACGISVDGLMDEWGAS